MHQKAQSILEVIIAMAIFSFIAAAMASLVVGGFNAMRQGGEQTQAEALAQEGIEALRSIHDTSWNELIYSPAVLSVSGGQWVLSSGESELIDGKYTRLITIENICRDALDEIVGCPGSYTDVNTKRMAVILTWEVRPGVTNSVQRVAYLSNWDSVHWVQTDWSGGPGQSIWSNQTRYDSDNGNVNYDAVGEIKLASAADGTWVVAGGDQFIDTTAIDFNSGIFNDTVVAGSGEGASIALSEGVIFGTFLSRVFDSGDSSTHWDTTHWTELLPSRTDLTIATRTGNTPAPDETWSSFSRELTKSQSSDIFSPNGQYLQYRTTLTRDQADFDTPHLADITIIYNSVTTKNLNDLDSISANDIWAIGNSGKVLHYDGDDWSEFVDLGGDELYAIGMVSASDGWIVGEVGIIFHYDGTSWSSVSSPVSQNLNSIFMVSASDGWAVGEGGTIIHYDGTSWLSVSSPTNKELNSIFMVSASDGWTVGEDGIILNYDGSDWSEFIDTGDEVWSDVFMVSASDGWMVGDSGRIYHYDGSDWSEFTDTGSTNWQSVYLFASDDGQVVGNNGDIYKYDGLEWTSVSSPTNKRLKTVQMLASDDSWAVGNSGIILHFIIEGLFKENGYFISSAFDMGDSSPIQTVEWDQSIPTCSPTCEIRLQIRAAPDASGSPGTWTNWYGENGVDTYFTNADGTIIPLGLNNNQWMQYRVELIGDNLDTPILQEARINYR